MSDLLLLHAGITLALLGLIWTVQLVHYPLFGRVGVQAFADYHRGHSWRILLLVGPLMLAELLTAAWLVRDRPPFLAPWLPAAGLGLVLVIWISTAFIQAPQHRVLSRGFETWTHRALVRGNWLRTWAWTARGALVLEMLRRGLG